MGSGRSTGDTTSDGTPPAVTGPYGRSRRRRELGLETLERFPCLVQAGLLSDQPGQRLEQFDGASEQLSTYRQRLRHRLVDVAQQLAGSIEKRFAGDGELDAVR